MRTAKLSIVFLLLLPFLANAQRNKQADPWHHSFNAYYQGGIGQSDEFLFGAALRYGLQYSLGEKTSLGLITGIENYNINLGELIFPLLATFAVENGEKKMRPYILLGAGYGFAAMYTNRPVLDTQGGFGADVQLGYKIPIRGKTAFSTGLGFRFQQATYTSRDIFDNNDVVQRTYQYKRVYWNIGINF
ncbi:MAG: hypothetical protein KDC24_05525 [Saprospiraceae bacterium]|nr:hypothetical protein [Saprospiraceae bacterium]